MYPRFILLCCLIIQIEARTECGVAGTPSGLIINGTSSAKGAWPWVAAIYKVAGDQFICGGTLVADSMVVTVNVINDLGESLRLIFDLLPGSSLHSPEE